MRLRSRQPEDGVPRLLVQQSSGVRGQPSRPQGHRVLGVPLHVLEDVLQHVRLLRVLQLGGLQYTVVVLRRPNNVLNQPLPSELGQSVLEPTASHINKRTVPTSDVDLPEPTVPSAVDSISTQNQGHLVRNEMLQALELEDPLRVRITDKYVGRSRHVRIREVQVRPLSAVLPDRNSCGNCGLALRIDRSYSVSTEEQIAA